MNLLEWFFGCWHRRTSFPLTMKRGRRRTAAATITGTYVVCLNCGKEFGYDWQQMKIVKRRDAKPKRERRDVACHVSTKVIEIRAETAKERGARELEKLVRF